MKGFVDECMGTLGAAGTSDSETLGTLTSTLHDP